MDGDTIDNKELIYYIFVNSLMGVAAVFLPIYFPIIFITVLILGMILLLRAEILFFLFIFATVAGGRMFSHVNISISGINIYVTEVVLFFFAYLLLLSLMRHGILEKYRSPISPFILLYLYIGVFLLVQGIEYGMIAFKHSALAYYSILFFITLYIVSNNDDIDKIIKLFFYGSLISLAYAVAMPFIGDKFIIPSTTGETLYYVGATEITTTGSLRYISAAHSMYLLFPFLFYISFPKDKIRHNLIVMFIIMIQVAIGILFCQHKSTWIAFLISLIPHYFISEKQMVRRLLRITLRVLIVSIIVILIVPPLRAIFHSLIIERFASVLNYQRDANSLWRLYTWKEFLDQYSQHPVLGMGFGRSVSFYFQGNVLRYYENIDPHNSHLAVLCRMGAFGFLVYLSINILFIYCLIKRYFQIPPHLRIYIPTSSISKRTTLGTIETGGIRSGKKAQPFKFRRAGGDRDHACAGEKLSGDW